MFRIRNRLVDVKANYRGKYKDDMTCRLCKVAEVEESQLHLFSCVEILSDNIIRDAMQGYTYADIFSTNLKTQEHMIDIWHKILKLRARKLNQRNTEDSSSQASPFFGASYTSDSVRHWI